MRSSHLAYVVARWKVRSLLLFTNCCDPHLVHYPQLQLALPALYMKCIVLAILRACVLMLKAFWMLVPNCCTQKQIFRKIVKWPKTRRLRNRDVVHGVVWQKLWNFKRDRFVDKIKMDIGVVSPWNVDVSRMKPCAVKYTVTGWGFPGAWCVVSLGLWKVHENEHQTNRWLIVDCWASVRVYWTVETVWKYSQHYNSSSKNYLK